MKQAYSVELCRRLKNKFNESNLYRPMQIIRYDTGSKLTYNVTGVEKANEARITLIVESFVGGGFAGQVYRVKVLKIESKPNPTGNLEEGKIYALKILIPPSSRSRLFRNLLYWIGFQGSFQLQTNPTASRAGALWQKFIRKAAGIHFNDEKAVNDVHATFVDNTLGSCGEISDWVDGRTWRLEVNDRMDLLKRYLHGKKVDTQQLNSSEYLAKKKFMADFVKLLHKLGAHEFARQYEWSTCKSQPNCLKRTESNNDPSAGLTAVDFRAGLTLLPFLPMSPGDFKLIWQGLKRGSIVQFDRGDINKLENFVRENEDNFSGMYPMLEELKSAEDVYRNSVPDITHNHVRLLFSRKLWSTIIDSAVTGWKIKGLIDDKHEQKFRKNKFAVLAFFAIGSIPMLGRLLRKCWARPDWRKHYLSILTNPAYSLRAIHGKMAEKAIAWHRAGRVNEIKAEKISNSIALFLCHLPLSFIFVFLHRFFTDKEYAKSSLEFIFVRPIKLYFNANLRRQWLKDMVTEGKKKHILSEEDAETILSQINEPYIQKYLVSLVVHVMTLPITQIVSVTVAGIYYFTHSDQPNAWAIGIGILGLFQITPISPGSLVRGFYVLSLVIKEKNFKDYNIAVFLGFFKYIGYLAFPIQMTYRYPALARFMASHWATDAVHIVPVFGEKGALLEHWAFCLFYNWPLTIRRRMRNRIDFRKTLKPRYWHIGLISIFAAALLGLVDFIYANSNSVFPTLRNIWYLAIFVPVMCGSMTTLWSAGTVLWKRFISAIACGIATGILYTAATAILSNNLEISANNLIAACIWRMFAFAIFSCIAAVITELKLSDTDLAN